MKTWHYVAALAGLLMIIGIAYWGGRSYQAEGKFVSKNLGISFTLPTEDWKIRQLGKRVYVYDPAWSPTEGQSVEVFFKNPNESFESAIKREVLTGYSQADTICTVEITADEVEFQRAIIFYPQGEEEGHWWDNAQYCNPDYAMLNGVRYFIYFPQYPDRFFFFNIGQYAIETPEGEIWQNTFKVLPLR